MRTKILFATIFFISLTKLQSQNLLFKELLEVKNSNLAYVEEFLTQKNWSLIESTAPTYEKMGILTFSYEASSINKAESFIYYMFSNNEKDSNRLSIGISNKQKYLEYLKEIKTNKGKLTSSYVENEELVKVYTNSIYRFTITTYSEFTKNISETYWQIVIRDIDD